MSWYSLWLVLHVLAAVVGFGPTYAFPLISSMARKQPQHAAFATKVILAISKKYTFPAVLSLPVSGTAMILIRDLDLTANPWLTTSIVLYVIAVTFSIVQQTPNAQKMLATLESMPPGPPPAGAPGPPPAVAALGKKLAMGGMLLTLLSVAIFALMLSKPGV